MNESVREKAAGLADTAKEQVRSQFDQKKGSALGELDTLVSALRRAGSEMGDSSGISGQIINTLTTRLETFSRSMDGKDLNGVMRDVETFARRNPAAFLGSAIAVGFLASRFLKSSGGGLGTYGGDRDDFATRSYATSYGSDFAAPESRPATGGTGFTTTPTSGSVLDTPIALGTTSSDFGSTGRTGSTTGLGTTGGLGGSGLGASGTTGTTSTTGTTGTTGTKGTTGGSGTGNTGRR